MKYSGNSSHKYAATILGNYQAEIIFKVLEMGYRQGCSLTL